MRQAHLFPAYLGAPDVVDGRNPAPFRGESFLGFFGGANWILTIHSMSNLKLHRSDRLWSVLTNRPHFGVSCCATGLGNLQCL